jgi:hypothetical protein
MRMLVSMIGLVALLTSGCADSGDDETDQNVEAASLGSFLGGPTLPAEQPMFSSQSLVSKNGKYSALYANGSLAVYADFKDLLWSSRTGSEPSDRVVLQTDGDLVIRNGQDVVWSSHTSGGAARRMVMQDDGNLVIYRKDGTAAWATHTQGGQPAPDCPR